MSLVVGRRRAELRDAHVAQVQRVDQALDRPALAGCVPALEQHADRRPELPVAQLAAERAAAAPPGARGRPSAARLVLLLAELERQVELVEASHGPTLPAATSEAPSRRARSWPPRRISRSWLADEQRPCARGAEAFIQAGVVRTSQSKVTAVTPSCSNNRQRASALRACRWREPRHQRRLVDLVDAEVELHAVGQDRAPPADAVGAAHPFASSPGSSSSTASTPRHQRGQAHGVGQHVPGLRSRSPQQPAGQEAVGRHVQAGSIRPGSPSRA